MKVLAIPIVFALLAPYCPGQIVISGGSDRSIVKAGFHEQAERTKQPHQVPRPGSCKPEFDYIFERTPQSIEGPELQAVRQRPTIYANLAKTFYCQPCENFKAAVAAGKLGEFRIEYVDGAPKMGGYPEFHYVKPDGITHRVNGWDDAYIRTFRRHLLQSGQQVVANQPARTKPSPRRTQPRLPVVETPWGRIDLETYNRDCNCPMCQGIRDLQQQYRQQANSQTKVDAGQEPTPDEVLSEMLVLMNLRPSDVLADLGCGDGRVMIEAVRKFNIRAAIGIEIDPKKADEARRAVSEAGLSDRILVQTGDARSFNPSAFGVTAITAFLFPELLAELAPTISQARVYASPFHAVPGLPMSQVGNVWIACSE